jgi:ribosomal protein S18 acetylase RimI-like enzyme
MDDDLIQVRSIVESCGLFYSVEIDVAVELVQEYLTKGTDSGYRFLFASQADEAIGYTCYGLIPMTVARYDLYWIAVQKSYQDQGIGRQLLEETERRIHQLKGERIYVETSSRKPYDATHLFYQSRGYSKEAVLPDYYAPGDNKVIYMKHVGQ